MELVNLFKCFVEGYYGIREMDEYTLKEYALKDIENYIRDFVSVNKMDTEECISIAQNVKDNISIKTKLQSSLIILNKMNFSMELILLVKKRIKNIEKEENS